jgi:glutamate synthase (NADPH/NADH) large chain
MPKRIKSYCVMPQDHGLSEALDYKLIEMSKKAIADKSKVNINMEIKNVNRSVGIMLSGTIAKKYGSVGLPEDTITINFKGSAGQSFGAFGVRGLTLILEGDANDYVGKGLSGGKVIIKTPEGSTFVEENNIIAGNTILYGATSGKLFLNGSVGERFAVRNSGALSVVEGVGEHGCEYMTGGVVVIIGKMGRNFAAGMSGGIAYVLDEDNSFNDKCNMEMVEIQEDLDGDDMEMIEGLLKEHYKYTDSTKAEKILNQWNTYKTKFKKVIPTAYKLILEQQKSEAAAASNM